MKISDKYGRQPNFDLKTRRTSSRVLMFCIFAIFPSVFFVQQAAAENCGYASSYPNPSCPPGTPVYNEMFQQQLQEQQRQQQQQDNQASQENLKRLMEQNDPGSPYYLTPAQQCEQAKYALFCTLGIACLPPPGVDCPRPVTRQRSRSHFHPQ